MNLPKSAARAISRVLEFEQQEYEDLLEALSSYQGPIGYSELLAEVQAEGEVIEGLISLATGVTQLGIAPKTFLQYVTTEFKTESTSRKKVVERLANLMNSRPIRLVGKALGLQIKGERVFFKAEILTDLRSVFEDEESDRVSVVAQTIIHNLHVSAKEGSNEQLYTFVLDSRDLRALKQIIDRALLKDEALHRTCRVPIVENFDGEGEHGQ